MKKGTWKVVKARITCHERGLILGGAWIINSCAKTLVWESLLCHLCRLPCQFHTAQCVIHPSLPYSCHNGTTTHERQCSTHPCAISNPGQWHWSTQVIEGILCKKQQKKNVKINTEIHNTGWGLSCIVNIILWNSCNRNVSKGPADHTVTNCSELVYLECIYFYWCLAPVTSMQ